MDASITYEFPNADITALVVTNDRKTAAQYIERGYTLFTVPQMFGREDGEIVLMEERGASACEDGLAYLATYEQEARDHFSGGGESLGQMNVNH